MDCISASLKGVPFCGNCETGTDFARLLQNSGPNPMVCKAGVPEGTSANALLQASVIDWYCSSTHSSSAALFATEMGLEGVSLAS